jgi:hypothetical protein
MTDAVPRIRKRDVAIATALGVSDYEGMLSSHD